RLIGQRDDLGRGGRRGRRCLGVTRRARRLLPRQPPRAAILLYDVGKLVREQPRPRGRVWLVFVTAEDDVPPPRVRPRLNRPRRLRRLAVALDPHPGEVPAEPRLEPGTRRR